MNLFHNVLLAESVWVRAGVLSFMIQREGASVYSCFYKQKPMGILAVITA